MEGALLAWCLALCTAAAINVVLWAWSARTLSPEAQASRRSILWLSAIYTLGCGFRSVFPMIDAPRLCLHDNWISRIAVGRTIATFAELSLALQWALLLREATQSRAAALASRAIVPVIFLAEICSWGAVLVSNYLLHAVENSLWTLAAALVLAALLSLRPGATGATARFLEAACVSALVYIAYMVIEDVPMYLARWRAAGGHTVPLDEGIRTLLERCVVRREWSAWREDATWLSLYFTVGVWISVMLPHAPRLRPSAK